MTINTQNKLGTILVSFFCIFSFANAQELNNESSTDNLSGMTMEKMTAIIKEHAQEVDNAEGNGLVFSYNDVPLTLIAAPQANRMRIVTPIIEANQLSLEEMLAISVSNFHLALDARYAIGGDTLYAIYIHPLQELNREQIESAIRQVSTLRLTFGTTFTSGELRFGVQQPRGQTI